MKNKIKKFIFSFLEIFRAVILIMIAVLFPLIAVGYFIIAIFMSTNILIGLLKMFVVAPTILVFGIMASKTALALGIYEKIKDFFED